MMTPSSERKRQWVHISCALFALTLRYLPPSWAFLFAFTAFIHNILLLPKYAPQLFREREHLLQGVAAYPLMVALLILFFPERLNLAGGAWAILAFGDGFSNIIGRKWPIARIPWNPKKSFGGSTAFVVMASLGAYAAMMWIGPVPFRAHIFFVAVSASAAAAFFETLPLAWDDNVVVTLVAAAILPMAWEINLANSPTSLTAGWWALALLINVGVASFAWWIGLVSSTGALGGTVIGTAILAMGGDLYILLLIFFFLASLATRVGYYEKEALGIAQEEGGRRGAKHAIANCALALLAAVLIGATDGADAILYVFYCAALATALGDTTSSELGQVYGRNPFLPTTFRRVQPGFSGAISIEGTLCGMGACFLFALISFALSVISFHCIPAVTIGSWLGFYAESYIAALWSEEGVELDNEWMNFLNTLLGGVLAIIIAALTLGF